MTSFFNYKGDAAGPTYEDYEFEVEDIELNGNSYVLTGLGSFDTKKGFVLDTAEIWDASTETWCPIAVDLVPSSWKDAVENEEQSYAEKAQEQADESFYG